MGQETPPQWPAAVHLHMRHSTEYSESLASAQFPVTWGGIWLRVWRKLSGTEGKVRQLAGLWFRLCSRKGVKLSYLCVHTSAYGLIVEIQSDHGIGQSGEVKGMLCWVSNDPMWLLLRGGGRRTRVAWDPFNVPSVSPESGCLLTVFQVVDDPRDGLLSCGAHGTLWETEWGKQECESANMYNNTIPLLHRGCLSSCSLERDIYETDGFSLQFWQDESHSKAAAKSTSVSV